jgi:hypothetical protein
VGLNLIDSKKRRIVVHEILDLAPVAETPELKSVYQVYFIISTPFRIQRRKL